MIRKAMPSDYGQLVALAIEALQIDHYEELVISKDKVSALVRNATSSAQHFLWVSELDGRIVGAIGAGVFPLMFHERSSASIALWYCKSGNDGFRLLDKFMQWAKERPMIKQVQYCTERKGDPRIQRVLERRYGFKSDVKFLYRNR